MRKFLLLLTSIMMVLGMAACGGAAEEQEQNGNTPEATVTTLLEAIKIFDQTTINQCVEEDDNMYTTEIGESQDAFIFENLTYNIESVHSNEGRAFVTVVLSNINMAEAFQTYLENVMALGEEAQTLTEEETLAKLKEAIEQNKENIISRTMDLELNQGEDGQWKVKTTDDFLSIISGGMADEMAFE